MARPLKLLCLHGWRTSASIMKIQLAGFLPSADIVYCPIDGTFPASGPPDSVIQQFFPGETYFEWWDNQDDVYTGAEQTLGKLAAVIDAADPPFDGVLGFSQGAVLASLLSVYSCTPGLDPRFFEKFRFAVLIAGFVPRDALFKQLYHDGGIGLPSLHVWGSGDSIAPGSANLARKFDQKSIMLHIHDGSHVVPKLKPGTESYDRLRSFFDSRKAESKSSL
ncbi:Esterase [Diplonema papillatum]|nr:Esterase [Diplonema papillatum]